MIGGSERHVLAALKEIPVGLHHGAGSGIEGLEEPVAELDRWVGVVGCRKARRGAGDGDGRFKHKARGDRAGIGAGNIALAIDVLDGEGKIDGGLIGIVVQADGELICVRGNFGCGGVGVGLKRAGGVVGHWIASEHGGNAGIDRDV